MKVYEVNVTLYNTVTRYIKADSYKEAEKIVENDLFDSDGWNEMVEETAEQGYETTCEIEEVGEADDFLDYIWNEDDEDDDN